MTAIEKKYDEFIKDFRAALAGGDQPLVQKMDKEMNNLMLQWCKEAPRNVLELKEELTNKQLEVGLNSCIPIIRELTDGSYVMLVHGTPEGRFIDAFWDALLWPEDNRVALYFPRGATVYVLSCFPGARSKEWTHIGVHFVNLAHEAGEVPLAGGVEGNKLYVREVSQLHANLISDMEDGRI